MDSLQISNHDSLQASKLFSLKDFVCLVTGGGSSIGLMAAQALAANRAKVYITGRRTEVLEEAAKQFSPVSQQPTGQIIPIGPCDVTSKSDLEELVSSIEAKERYLSLLVAAAGVSGPKGSPGSFSARNITKDSTDGIEIKKELWKEDMDAWNSTYSIYVSSVYFSTVAFCRSSRRRPRAFRAPSS